MRKRLQVLLDAREYADIQRIARRQGLTLAEWVRHALRAASRQAPPGDEGKKLEALRAAAQMLAEIERPG